MNDEAEWELRAAEAIRIARGDLDTRINNIRAPIAANHEREIQQLRTELDCDAAVVLWLNEGA